MTGVLWQAGDNGCRGTICTFIIMHFLPDQMRRFLHLTSITVPNFVKVISHPASSSFTTEIREQEASPGTIRHAHVAPSKSGLSNSAAYDYCTWDLSGNLILIGFCAIVLLSTGASVSRK